MNQLQIVKLKKTYSNGIKALNDISMTIGNGMFGLLGPNGAGKSTLMKTIAGLQAPDSGQLTLNDVDIIKDPIFIKKQLGFLPQDFGVYPKITAIDLLTHIAVLKGIPNTSARKEQINALLQNTNLYQYRHQEVHSFSGGMKQRFGIAQALLGNPQIIIVDEPTAGLDPEERNRFNNLLSEIGEQVIVILSTHLVEDVRNLCTNMAIINNGQLMLVGSPAELVSKMQGKIWEKIIDKRELPEYQSLYKVISTQLQGGRLSVRILAEVHPMHEFSLAVARLEDVYFATLQNVFFI